MNDNNLLNVSNIPNLVYCLKTGKYNEKYNQEVEKEVSREYGITKEVLRMAAVRCCFNCNKTDILHDLLLDYYDLNKLETEIKCMEDSGLFIIDMKHKTCKIANGYDITDAHDFFYNNRNIDFFNYCNDFLTSWDACSLVYKNNFPPSLLAQYACITQAEEPESLVPAVLASIGKVKWKEDKWGKKLNAGSISVILTSNRTNYKVRNFLKENNYDFKLAQAKFNWTRQDRYHWRERIRQYLDRNEHIKMVRKYPLLTGIPLIVKPSGSPSYFMFIDFNGDGKDFNKLVEKALDIQKKAIIQYENNKLNKVAIEIINQELAECYDMLLYLYVSEAESIIDYNKGWKARYRDKIMDKLMYMGILGQVWLFKDVISTMFFSNNIGKCLYKINGWTDLLIDNNDNISMSLIK